MSDKPDTADKPAAVFPMLFQRAVAGDDGQSVFFSVLDRQNQPAWVQVPWRNLSQMAHMLNQAGVEAAEKRKAKGEPGEFTGVGSAQIVSGFRIANLPEQKVKLLSLISPSGLRADYALSADARGKDGRPILQALAEELAK
jgi:hypothetical protein